MTMNEMYTGRWPLTHTRSILDRFFSVYAKPENRPSKLLDEASTDRDFVSLCSLCRLKKGLALNHVFPRASLNICMQLFLSSKRLKKSSFFDQRSFWSPAAIVDVKARIGRPRRRRASRDHSER